ncbi:MAG: 5-oxoprolinase [Proteobacteria bacterium]|nr:5-oxoprolinase [Pseudomonadota bacterium]HCQ99193.1 5-oxoprolinase [Acidobacteriota bacterium]
MIDPITAEIVVHAISAIPNLIDKNITKTAFSPLVSEYKDYAVGIVDADGKLITQCKGGIPIFVANALSAAVRDGLEIYGKSGLQTGDIVITNHAGTMGQHLNNVVMYTPIRRSEGDDGLFGFMAIVMHWVDVGGIVVGSCLSNETTDVFQEGIQFHTVKLHSRGEPVAEMYRMITANTRFPHMVLGDLEAQIAGCLHGRSLVDELLDRYGADQVQAAVERYWDQSEAAVKRAIADIPNGTYEASSFLDNDGVHEDETVEVNVAVHVTNEGITVDLSGIGPEASGPMNAGYEGGAVAASRIACKYFFSPDDPANDGAFRPIKVHCPPGRFLSAGPTAPLSGSGNMLPTVVDTILKAFGSAVPEKVPAGHHGTYCLHVITGQLADDGGWFQHMESTIGGWGAWSDHDGVGPFRSIVHGDTMEVPVELQEANHPYRVDWVRLRADSGGAGKHRGGLGIEKCYTMLGPADVTAIIERTKCPPWGLDGGREGETGRVEVHRAGADCSEVLIKGSASLAVGDRALLFSGGGGGHGNPVERSTDSVAEDVRKGYVSRRAALKDYGWT